MDMDMKRWENERMDSRILLLVAFILLIISYCVCLFVCLMEGNMFLCVFSSWSFWVFV